jgi:hypothetical protein
MLHAIFGSLQGKAHTDGLTAVLSTKEALEGLQMYAEKKKFKINNV